MRKRNRHGESLRRRGFDQTSYIRAGKYFRASCSQCQVVCINGVACHETGCPNERRARQEQEARERREDD